MTTDTETIALLDQALQEAFVAYFAQLFSVLMVAEDAKGLERFQRGLTKLLDTRDFVAEIIRELENEDADG